MSIIRKIKDRLQGKAPAGSKRSSRWPTVRKAHLAEHPECAVCGGTKKCEVHHVHPFHLKPELELDPTNLITLCESKSNGITCHLTVGHLGSYKSFNKDVKEDAATWAKKFKNRP